MFQAGFILDRSHKKTQLQKTIVCILKSTVHALLEAEEGDPER